MVALSRSKVAFTTSLLPAHVFVCSRRTLALLSRFPGHHNSSFKDDVLPLLCKAQWQGPSLLSKTLSQSTTTDSEPIEPPKNPYSAAFQKSSTSIPLSKQGFEARERERIRKPLRPQTNRADSYYNTTAPPTPATEGMISGFGRKDGGEWVWEDEGDTTWLERVGVVVWTKEDGFVVRGNTVESWMAANRAVRSSLSCPPFA
jgi:translation initiation factor eIF-2B subunit gamma